MLAILFGSMLIFIAFGMDISFAMGLSALGYVSLSQLGGRPLPFSLIPQQLMSGSENFSLVAIPLFILAGELMNMGGITEKLVKFAQSLVGHLRGGLGHTCIIVNMILAGMSGSSVADAAATGAILIPMMKEEGYTPSFAAALVASASTIGPIIPPSIPMIIIGSIVGVSVGKMFIGGAIPGIIMGLAMMVATYLIASKRKFSTYKRASFHEILIATRNALLPLGLPVVVLGGILTGITTPTEAAVLGVWYSFILIVFVYKTTRIRDFSKAIVNTAVASGGVLFTCAAGVLFGWVATVLQLGPRLANILFAFSTSPVIILAIINIILLIMGMVMATIPIILLMTPILFPIVQQLGINPIHFGVIMCLNLMIGVLTPPLGLHLFIASSIAKIPVGEVIKEVTPLLCMLILVLILVTYVPQITLWLPDLLIK